MKTLRLFCALLVAGLASLNSRAGWERIGAALTLWATLAEPESQVEPAVYERRLAVCRKCPVFYKPLQTCGSPISAEHRGIGCYCGMEFKSKLSGAHCWIDQNPRMADYQEYGWTRNGAH